MATTDLATHAEIVKLARVLDISADDLTLVEALPADDIRQLRERISNLLYDEHRGEFRRIAKASGLVPNALAAKVAVRTFSALLSARMASELSPDRLGDLAGRFPVHYLADVTLLIDPRIVPPLLERIDIGLAEDVAQELVQREEFITLGQLIDAAPDDVLATVAEGIESDEALLMIGLYAESPQHLGKAVDALPEDRVRRVVHLGVAGTPELQAASLSLMSRVDDDLRARLGDMAAEADEGELSRLLDTAIDVGGVGELLHVVTCMSEDAQERIMRLPPLQDEVKLEHLVRAVVDHGLWDGLLPLAAYMDEPLRRRLAGLVDRLEPAELEAIVRAAHEHELWPPLLGIAEHLDPAATPKLFDAVDAVGDDVLPGIVSAVAAEDVWDRLLPLTKQMSDEMLQRLAGLVHRLEPAELDAIVQAAHTHRLWPSLMGLAGHLDGDGMVALFRAVGSPEGDVVHVVVESAEADDLWPQLLEALARLNAVQQREIAATWKNVSTQDRQLVEDKAAGLGLAEKLEPMREAL